MKSQTAQIKTVRDLLDYLYTLEEKAGTISLAVILSQLEENLTQQSFPGEM